MCSGHACPSRVNLTYTRVLFLSIDRLVAADTACRTWRITCGTFGHNDDALASHVVCTQEFVPARMDKTLEENGIVDDDVEFEKLGMDEDDGYMPVLHIYFNDDLTIA